MRFSDNRILAAAVLALLGCSTARTPSQGTTMAQDGRPAEGQPDAAEPPSTAGEDAEARPPGETPTAVKKVRVEFKGSRGDTVPGYLWMPTLAAGQTAPALLVMYGSTGDKDSPFVRRPAEMLAARGFICLTIDWPGTGERGDISKMERIMNPSVKDWTVADYGAAFNFLESTPGVDKSRLGLFGASMGAMTGIVFASQDARVRAVAAVVPVPNPFWSADNPAGLIGALAPRPVLCIGAASNSDMSGTVCAGVGEGGESRLLPGGHKLADLGGDVLPLTQAFLAKHLLP